MRSRNGYYALADTASAAEREAQKLTDAIRSPLESTDLEFEVQADGVEVSGARQMKVKISLDAGQLRFERQGARWTGQRHGRLWAQFSAEGVYRSAGEISDDQLEADAVMRISNC